MVNPLILLSGIPGSGKSTFGQWLSTTKGFIHVDMEKDGLDKHSLRRAWDTFINEINSHKFIEALTVLKRPVALDWGFPVRCLEVVQGLQRQGITLWWFTGDRLHTRNYFEARGTVPVDRFDKQYANISNSWALIAPVVGRNIVRTVRTDGSHFSDEEVYKIIFK